MEKCHFLTHIHNCGNENIFAKVEQEAVKMTNRSGNILWPIKCEWQMTVSFDHCFMTVTEMRIKMPCMSQSGEKYIPFLSHSERNDDQEKVRHRLWIVPSTLRIKETDTERWRIRQKNLRGIPSHSHFCFCRGTLGTQIHLIADRSDRQHKEFRHERKIHFNTQRHH